jgi:hypothetical protein
MGSRGQPIKAVLATPQKQHPLGENFKMFVEIERIKPRIAGKIIKVSPLSK